MDIINYSKIKKVEADLAQHKLDYVEDINNINSQLLNTMQEIDEMNIEYIAKHQEFAEKIAPHDFEIDIVNGAYGFNISSEITNLLTNPSFENNLAGWNTYAGVEVTDEVSFHGSNSVKLTPPVGSGLARVRQLLTLEENGDYMIAFAVYSPDTPPHSGNGLYIHLNSVDVVINSSNKNFYPSNKKDWWWIVYNFVGGGVARNFGVRVNEGYNYIVDSIIVAKTNNRRMQFVENIKVSNNRKIECSADKVFTVGLIVKSEQMNEYVSDTAVIGVFKNNTTKYKVEYRKADKKIALVKYDNEVVTAEIESDVITFNPNGVLGVAIQQTPTELKLFTTINRGIVIDFDDARKSVYTNAFPILKKYNIPATTHVITNIVGNENFMSNSDLQELKRRGWTIDSHTNTHLDLSTLTKIDQYNELKTAMDWLKSNGYDYDLLATPYGGFNNDTRILFREMGIKLHRGYSSLGYGSNLYPFLDKYAIKSDPVTNAEISLDTINRIDTRMANSQLMFLTFHGVDVGAGSGNYDPIKFAEVIEHIVNKRYPIYTFNDIKNSLYNNLIIGDVREYSVSSTPSDSNLIELYIGTDENNINHFNGVYSKVFIVSDNLGMKELADIWGAYY